MESYKTAFNFVGLYDGFNELAEEKQEEAKGLVKWIIILAGVAIIPVVIELWYIYSNLENISQVRDGLIVSAFPTLSLLVVSVYYFRILLQNHKSLKAQLLQLELRKTLCRFIQHYADYSKEIKDKDNDALSKFENIIFSGLVLDEGDIPSTYGGIEQFSEFIKTLKS